MNRGLFLFLLCLASYVVFSQQHSFDDLFPGLDPEQKEQAFSGVLTETREQDFYLHRAPPGEPGEKITAFVLADLRPVCLVECLTVIPYRDAPLDLLALYNAAGNIRDLKGRLYHSATKDKNIPLFEDATRVQGPNRSAPLPDPENSAVLPATERIYIRLKDSNFGNSYYQGDIAALSGGLLYGLTNFKTLSYGIISVIRKNKFRAQFYVAPIAEGVLVYGAAAAEVGDFIAGMIHIPSAIRKRIEVIFGWLVDNIRLVH